MKFKIGDYAVHYAYPKSEVVLHITDDMHKQVINASADDYRHAFEEEIKQYHEDISNDSTLDD